MLIRSIEGVVTFEGKYGIEGEGSDS